MVTVDRRQFLKRAGVAGAGAGAVWVAPSVLGTDAAWAAASGPCGTLPNLNMVTPGTSTTPANNNGWIYSATNMVTTGTDALGVVTNWYALPLGFVVERNPVTPTVTNALVTYTHPLGTLVGGRTYTFSYSTLARTVNEYTQNMKVLIINTATSAVVATLAIYTTSTTPVAGEIQLPDDMLQSQTPVSFTAPAGGGTYSLQFNFTFLLPGVGTNGVGDDIGVSPPTITCA